MNTKPQNNIYSDELSDDVFYIIGHKSGKNEDSVGNTKSTFSRFSLRREGDIIYIERKND